MARVVWGGVLLRAYGGLVLIFLLAPLAIIVVTSVTSGETMGFPPPGVSLRWYEVMFRHVREAPGTKPFLLGSFTVSLTIAVVASLLAVIAGTVGGLGLSRCSERARAALRGTFLLPVMSPQLVTGVGLLLLFSLVGRVPLWLRLVLGHAILSLPYVLVTVGAALEVHAGDLEEAAVGLGSTPPQAFFLVTLPLIGPAIAAGGIFSFMISFNQFTVTYFLYGGETKPLPMWLFEYMNYFMDPMLAAISTVLIGLTLIVTLALERTVGLRRMSVAG